LARQLNGGGAPYLDVLAAFRNDLRVLANSRVELVSDYLGTYLAFIDVWTFICGPALVGFLLFIDIIVSFHAIMSALFFVVRRRRSLDYRLLRALDHTGNAIACGGAVVERGLGVGGSILESVTPWTQSVLWFS
jgi:hypothetical protein